VWECRVCGRPRRPAVFVRVPIRRETFRVFIEFQKSST